MAPPKTELKAEKGKQSYSREGHLKKYIQKIKSNNSKQKKKTTGQQQSSSRIL